MVNHTVLTLADRVLSIRLYFKDRSGILGDRFFVAFQMPHLAVFYSIFRLTIGVEWSNVAELVDTDILSEAITFIQLETSIGVFVSPLLGGTISDRTGDYSYVFYIAGILLLSGRWILEPTDGCDKHFFRRGLCRFSRCETSMFVWGDCRRG